MNRELEKAEGDILLIANSDARLMTTLVPMLEILDKDSNAIVGPKIVDEEGNPVPEGEVLPVERVAGHGDDAQPDEGPESRHQDGDDVGAQDDLAVLEYHAVGFQRGRLGQDGEAFQADDFLRAERSRDDEQEGDDAQDCVCEHDEDRKVFHETVGRCSFYHNSMNLLLEERVVRLDHLDDLVHDHDDGEPDDRLVEADRRRGGEVEVRHGRPVHVGFDDVRGRIEQGVAADDVVEEAEVALDDAAERKEDEDDEGGLEARQLDVADPLECVYAVNLGRLDRLAVYAHDRGEVDDRVVARHLPELDDDDEEGPHLGILVGRPGLHVPGLEQAVQEAVFEVEDVVDQEPDEDGGDEVGQQHYRLRDFLEPADAYLVDEDGHEDGDDVVQHEEGEVVGDRVAGQVPEAAGREEELEVGQSHELAAEDALCVVVLDEGDVEARQGQVVERDEEQDGGHAHEDERPAPMYFLREGERLSHAGQQIFHGISFLKTFSFLW
mgnify:CR=1 FL=1